MNVFSIKQGQGLKASGHTSLPKLSFSAPRACITLHVSSIRAGGRRFTWTRRLLFFGNYPSLNRVLVCCHWIIKPKFNDVCVLFKHSNFCSRMLEMHSRCIQIFPGTRAHKSHLCREFVSFFTYSKAFAIYLKSYQKPWSYQTFFIFL